MRIVAPKALQALATTAVIALAAAAWHNLPTSEDVNGSFEVHAGIDQQATGRNLTAEVTGVRIAPRVDRVQSRAKPVDAVGMWVAADCVMTGTITSDLPHAELLIGPNTYTPAERLGLTPLGIELSPAITQRGAWVFDVPADLTAAGPKVMTLQLWTGDRRLGSALVFRLPLDDPHVYRQPVIELESVQETGP